MTHYDGTELHRTLCEALEFDATMPSSQKWVRAWLQEELEVPVSYRVYAQVTQPKADLVRHLGLAVRWCMAAGVDVHVHCERGVTFLVHFDSGLTEVLGR